jgi:hypothetical protein
VFYLPQFIWYSLRSARQAERARGFLGGRIAREAGNAFWTVTAWTDEAAMREYRGSGAHQKAMPKLLDWCDEASIVHWQQPSAELPDWQESYRRMVAEGRSSKVNHPSANQQAGRIAEPRLGRNDGRRLAPTQR